MRTLALAAILLVSLGMPLAQAKEQEMDVKKNGQVEFVAPSGNIGCIYTP